MLSGGLSEKEPVEVAYVDIWWLSLDSEEPQRSILSAAEERVAASLIFVDHRRRYRRCRAMLRRVLSRYTRVEPACIAFAYSEHGKPRVVSHPFLEFSIAHSKDTGVIAVAERAVGVDVESIDFETNIEALSTAYFSDYEQKVLVALPQSQRIPTFFACWTRKEAYAKCVGYGMSLPFNKFSVSLDPSQATGPVEFYDPWPYDLHSTICSLDAPPAFTAAVAAQGNTIVINARYFDENIDDPT